MTPRLDRATLSRLGVRLAPVVNTTSGRGGPVAVLAAPSGGSVAGRTGRKPGKGGPRSNVALGGSFEDIVEGVLSFYGHVQRGHPATKVIGRKVIHTAKNGVDFVGVAWGKAVAIEAKRLPGVASLRGAKDDSTRNEALWLANFTSKQGAAAFLVHDPEADKGGGVVYLVHGAYRLAQVATGRTVLLRDRQGRADLPAWWVRDAREHSVPTGLAGAVEYALRSLLRVPGEP